MKLDEQSKVQTRKAFAGRVKKKTTGQKWESNAIIRVFPQSPPPQWKKLPILREQPACRAHDYQSVTSLTIPTEAFKSNS